jgi:hypothetical protein
VTLTPPPIVAVPDIFKFLHLRDEVPRSNKPLIEPTRLLPILLNSTGPAK